MDNQHVHYNTAELNAIPFSSVITRLGGELERKGRRLVTKCPWHDDAHPSLVLYEERNRCVCYACNERRSRSVIDYVMQVKGYSFLDACEWLMPNASQAPLPASPRGRGACGVKGTGRGGKPKRKSIKELLAMDDSDIQRKLAYRRQLSTSGERGEGQFLEMDYLSHFVSSENSFCKCLKHIFPADIVEVFTQLYMLGNYSWLGNADDVLFPSIDAQFRIHNIKVQHYDCNPQSAEFFHCDKKHIYWLGDVLKKRGKIKEDAVFDNSTLFGEHLLKGNPDMPVALVESPKNAVVGACAFHDLVWVAAGNKGNISRKSLSCLHNRDVIVLPDRDAVDEWKAKILPLKDIASFTFSPFIERQLLECGSKGDIADWVIMKRQGG